MEESKQNKLPQIVVDLIVKLNDPNTPLFNRDLYRMRLQEIVSAAQDAIVQYDYNREKKKVARR